LLKKKGASFTTIKIKMVVRAPLAACRSWGTLAFGLFIFHNPENKGEHTPAFCQQVAIFYIVPTCDVCPYHPEVASLFLNEGVRNRFFLFFVSLPDTWDFFYFCFLEESRCFFTIDGK
jgi:hypothetical protein